MPRWSSQHQNDPLKALFQSTLKFHPWLHLNTSPGGIISPKSVILTFLTCCGMNFRASDEEVTITRMLDKILRRSDTIDKESLCILAGQRVCASLP